MAYNSSSYYETGYDDHAIKIPAFTTCLNINIQTQLHIIMPITTLPLLTATPFRFNTTPPKFCEQSYDTGVTQFLISYSVSPEFNDPEIDAYDEYDPTPYGGGYNIDLQYGKPLPPSNETCYPRSGSSPPPDLNVPSINGAIVPVSVGGKEAIADEKEAKPVNAISKTDQGRRAKSVEEGCMIKCRVGMDWKPMDICESLFGYWPCLARDLKRSNCEPGNGHFQQFDCEGRSENPWKGTADYLFGSSNPYGGERTTYHQYEDY
ncbi:hypothetical protein M0R45_002493 [Rubus argutus]|uniref:Uncharacterized protein n=1 Tax=Rubus argutus TaxID=59490 RepID=A0AAW1VN10_RUBAR